MAAVVLALFAGVLTIAAPCTLPVLPAMLGASLGRSDKARPAFIALGFVGSFAAAAVFFSVTTQVAGIDQTVLRAVTVGRRSSGVMAEFLSATVRTRVGSTIC